MAAPSPSPQPEDDLLMSAAARCMFPGAAVQVQAPVVEAELDLDGQLRLACLVVALRRAATWPGSGDMAFIAQMRRKKPLTMTIMERERLLVLSWRYRAQLPEWLRAKAQPNVTATA